VIGTQDIGSLILLFYKYQFGNVLIKNKYTPYKLIIYYFNTFYIHMNQCFFPNSTNFVIKSNLKYFLYVKNTIILFFKN